ncbi:monovalent cation/H(+) antiporter subunit G [Natrinema sp. DC36]|uniref:monovalent cation/H(+) antiporter subunit G n=1 Tax=Natrinema sp. DC36 TaxID=2878680 RepID=UPI001CF0C015|nr:monovalent cation/H(+) antiporter subunit G [Natrinema sp. DC36]
MIETIRFWAIVVLLGFGVLFTLVSTVGIIRLPDIYARAHTASQTDTLGAGFALAGVALAFGWQHGAIYTVLLLFFVFVTNPTAAHAIARSAAETGVEPILAEEGAGAETDETEAATETDGEP